MKKKIVTTLLTAILALSFVVPGYAAEQSGWKKAGGQTYYSENGNNITGWKQIDGIWYLFKADGTLHKGWHTEDGKKYYFKIESGEMLSNAYGPDGHWMNEDGHWMNEKVHERVGDLGLASSLPYILNWETDARAHFAPDLAVLNVFLGKESIDKLYPEEKEVLGVVNKFVSTEINDSDSDYDKVVKISKFIWSKAEYNANHSKGSYGILVDGKGLCDGYAKSFKLLANAVGLECYFSASTKYNHAWNIVKVDGEWYNADVTEPLSGYHDSDAPYVLRNDSEYAYSSFKDTAFVTPDCNGIEYTRSTIKLNNK